MYKPYKGGGLHIDHVANPTAYTHDIAMKAIWPDQVKFWHVDDIPTVSEKSVALPVKAAVNHLPVSEWLLNTGSGFDLVSRTTAERVRSHIFKSGSVLTMQTANGMTTSADAVLAGVPEMGIQVTANILESTPSVLSVGKRCMLDGCSFVWNADSEPYMVLPTGKRVVLTVSGFCPYLPANFGGERQSGQLGNSVLPVQFGGGGSGSGDAANVAPLAIIIEGIPEAPHIVA